jgi:bifunctional non-homologous end joining protein LigD
MQLRVAGGQAVMRTRKGLDWTSDFSAIAGAAGSWTTAPSTVRSWRSIKMAHRISPPCKPQSEGWSKDLTYFAFDLLYAEGEDLRTGAAEPRASSNTWSTWLSLATPCSVCTDVTTSSIRAG